MKTKSFFLIACVIFFVNTCTKTSMAQVPDLKGYEFYSANCHIIISMTVITKSYVYGDVSYWPDSRAIFQTVTHNGPANDGNKYFTMKGNAFVGKSSLPNNHNGPEQQYLYAVVNNDFSYVKYFSSLKYGISYETQGLENYYRACSSSFGTKIPYYDKLYYSYNNEDYLRLRYVLSGTACASKIGNIEWEESYLKNGDTVSTEQIVEYYPGENDRITIEILLKKYKSENTGGGGDFNGGGAFGSWGDSATDEYTGENKWISGNFGSGGYAIVGFKGNVEILRAGREDQPIVLDDNSNIKLKESDRIYTGMESGIRLQTVNGSIIKVEELTDFSIGDFSADADAVKTRLLIKSGEVNANINHESSIRSDFEIKMPTVTTSVRGTAFTVKTDSVTKISEVYTTDGTVVVSNKGFDSTQVAGNDFTLDSVEVNAWEKVMVNNHNIGDIQDFSISKVEISPNVVTIFPYQNYVFSPEGIANDGTKVPLKTNWNCTGGEVYENGIFVSNGEKGVYTVECYEPDHQLTASATIVVDDFLPDKTKPLYAGSPIAISPGDTLWTNIILGTENNTVKKLDSIAFDFIFTNPEFLNLFTSEASSFVVSNWASKVFDVRTQSFLAEGKIKFNLIPKNETLNLSGSGELLKVGFLADDATPALTDVDFSIVNIIALDSTGFAYKIISNTTKTTISEQVETPVIEADKTVFSSSAEADISTTDGSIIYYTTNGKTPTELDEMYVGTLTIDSTTVLRARAFKAGMLPGFVAEKGFLKVSNQPVNNQNIKLDKELNFNCYPNPVYDIALIEYNLQNATDVLIDVYNLAGIKLETLLSQKQNKGKHQLEWDTGHLKKNIYLLRINTKMNTQTIKLIK